MTDLERVGDGSTILSMVQRPGNPPQNGGPHFAHGSAHRR
jgi:hypothetical protein